jgi:hypothetical protein
VPDIQGLQRLVCYDCRSLTSVPKNQGFDRFECDKCVWLSEHINFQDNVEKLIKIQKWMKRVILRKRLLSLIPLYYHPLAKGGYFHKQDMEKFINSLSD